MLTTMNIALAVGAFTVLALTLTSGWIKSRLWASEALLCLLVGIALGPHVFGLAELNPAQDDSDMMLIEQVTRITLALSVMSAALALPTDYFQRNWRAMAWILLPGMALMWLATAGISWLLLDLSILMALLAGAIMTPTDPVLARSIVAGKLAEEKIPASTRRAITAESGANDGLALPLVLLPLVLMGKQLESPLPGGVALIWEVLGGAVIGWLLGKATGMLFSLAHRRGVSEQKSLTATTLALTFVVLAAVALAKADGILAVFIAGLVLNRAMKDEHQERHEHFQDVVDRSLTLPVFILLGAILPIEEWRQLGWPLWLTALGIVALRRLPAWLVLQMLGRPYGDMRRAAFAGWFGPVGVAALFYGAIAAQHGASAEIWPLVSLTIVLSIAIHGVSATPVTKRYWREAT